MNILHVNMSIDRVLGGGTAERTLQLHKALLQKGIGSQILTIDDSSDVNVEGVTRLACINKRWFIPFPEIRVVKELVEKADVIQLMNHWTLINIWVYFWARKLSKPYVVCPAGALTVFGRSKIKKYLYQFIFGKNIFRHASAAIAISPHEIELLKNMGLPIHLVHEIPNGVSENDFAYTDEALFRGNANIGTEPYILFVGRINEIKGPDLLLKAFSELKDKQSYHLVFAGPDGGMKDSLKQEAEAQGLESRVHFVGYLGGDMKSSAYHGAEFLTIPSRHEAMSIVALESAISGKPVLLTDQCGFSSLAEAGGGMEVPASIEGITKGLEDMLKDGVDLVEMGKYARGYVNENYSWLNMAKRFISLSKLVK